MWLSRSRQILLHSSVSSSTAEEWEISKKTVRLFKESDHKNVTINPSESHSFTFCEERGSCCFT